MDGSHICNISDRTWTFFIHTLKSLKYRHCRLSPYSPENKISDTEQNDTSSIKTSTWWVGGNRKKCKGRESKQNLYPSIQTMPICTTANRAIIWQPIMLPGCHTITSACSTIRSHPKESAINIAHILFKFAHSGRKSYLPSFRSHLNIFTYI